MVTRCHSSFAVPLVVTRCTTRLSFYKRPLLLKNFNKNGIENGKSHIHFQRDKPCASSHRRNANVKSKNKTAMKGSSQKKKERIFSNGCFVLRRFL